MSTEEINTAAEAVPEVPASIAAEGKMEEKVDIANETEHTVSQTDTTPQDATQADAANEDDGSNVSSGQSAGQSTDSAAAQTPGEEAGEHQPTAQEPNTSSPAASDAVFTSPPDNMIVPNDMDNEDAKTAPATDSDDNESDEETKSKKKNKKTLKKKSSSRYEPPPPFVNDPSKITLRFIFPNKDGLTVTVDCQPGDTVGEVKGQLLSMWPDELPDCSGGDRIRLICMGKGILMPDSRTLEDCAVPVFQTHATPVNVAVTPEHVVPGGSLSKKSKAAAGGGRAGSGAASGGNGGTEVGGDDY